MKINVDGLRSVPLAGVVTGLCIENGKGGYKGVARVVSSNLTIYWEDVGYLSARYIEGRITIEEAALDITKTNLYLVIRPTILHDNDVDAREAIPKRIARIKVGELTKIDDTLADFKIESVNTSLNHTFNSIEW